MIGKLLNDDDEGRDWLHVKSGVVDDDIGVLKQFLYGEPIAVSEARDAILRILHSGWDTLGVGRNLISILFDPGQRPKGFEAPVWTVAFKRAGKGHSKPARDSKVAAFVQACRDSGRSYEEAIGRAAKNFGIGERRAKQIYSKYKARFL